MLLQVTSAPLFRSAKRLSIPNTIVFATWLTCTPSDPFPIRGRQSERSQAPFAEIMLERLTTADAPPEQPQTRPIVPLGDRAHAQTQETDGGSTSSPPEDQRQASAAADCGTIVPSAGFGPSGGPRSARRPRLPKSAPLDQSCGPQVKSVSSYKQVPRTTVHSGNPPGRSRSGMRILR